MKTLNPIRSHPITKKVSALFVALVIACLSSFSLQVHAVAQLDGGGPALSPTPIIANRSFVYPKGYYGPKVFKRESGWDTGLDLHDWTLFTHIVACEAGPKGGYTETLAVANVILNRVKHGYWGKSIYGVVSAHNTISTGVIVWQFSTFPIWRTSTPQDYEIQACRDALNGWTNLPTYVQFFCSENDYKKWSFFRNDCIVVYKFGSHYYLTRKP